ncbi:MAG: PhnD/SsuA/transferrin family substrate-binding protein [Pseudomonadota bacterium]|nr:PhnD/SsuA/transferrin family substrate-binding protein [Pseudomonadota bacterium]
MKTSSLLARMVAPSTLLVALLMAPLAQAQSTLTFAVSEGTSGSGSSVGDAQMAAKYKPVVEVMERVLEQKVAVRYVREFRQLEEGMKSARFDLVMARPSDYPARGLRDYGYTAVTTTQPDGQCLVVVKADSPLKTLAEMKGKRFILPEQAAYMTKFCLAELRDQGIPLDPNEVTFVREQGAIPFALKNGLTQVGGIASYSGVATRLEKEGLRVIHESRPQPYLPLIAGAKIPPAKVQQLGTELVALSKTEQGAKALAAIGLKGFDTDSQQRLLDLLDWLGDKKN